MTLVHLDYVGNIRVIPLRKIKEILCCINSNELFIYLFSSEEVDFCIPFSSAEERADFILEIKDRLLKTYTQEEPKSGRSLIEDLQVRLDQLLESNLI